MQHAIEFLKAFLRVYHTETICCEQVHNFKYTTFTFEVQQMHHLSAYMNIKLISNCQNASQSKQTVYGSVHSNIYNVCFHS